MDEGEKMMPKKD